MKDLILVGFGHKNAPLIVRERLAVLPAQKVLEELRAANCAEAVVLSTCNRFEVYLTGGRAQDAVGLLEKLTEVPLASHSYTHQGVRAVLHLFEVASGLDSLVVGESEILGQVKSAYELAKNGGMTGKGTNVLFQRALYVGKNVRSETGIGVGLTSVASVAVQLAESIFGSLAESRVLILGAGRVAKLTAKHLLDKKVARLIISNRTRQRAEELAAGFGAQILAWDDFPSVLGEVDVIIGSTGSDRPVLTREMVAAVLRERSGRSLFIIDIAMPRDVEESVHGLDHVYLYRLEDLEAIVAESLAGRHGEIERARNFVLGKVREFAAWADSVASGREISLKHSAA